MADEVKVVFTADVSNLQAGLALAVAGVGDTTGAMKAGAMQVGQSFAALQQAYAAGMVQRVAIIKGGAMTSLPPPVPVTRPRPTSRSTASS